MRTNRSGSDKDRRTAARNRREIVKAALSRRALIKLGLVTSGGYLVAKHGLSASASGGNPQSPTTRAFIEPLQIMPVKQPVDALSPAPTVAPNAAAGEGRTRSHQALARFPPRKLYEVHQRAGLVSMSPDLPLQEIWGFDGTIPGPTYIARYGEPILVRNFNDLPDDNGGFGLNEVSTHQHNGHTPSESDGFACDFFRPGQFYDQHYPNMLAGFDSTHPPFGDPNEALGTLWYHDHRVDFTSQNVYKGLAGTYLLFNDRDTGDETTGFRLPSGHFDVPLIASDKVFDEDGQLFFDLFNLDGILGDKFLVNGKIQPFFEVHPRRYRFRLLDAGPSRFYKFFLTDLNSPTTTLPFWQIGNDGNLLPKPVQVTNVLLSVAERVDIIIDFSQLAGRSIVLENRLEQTDGRGPSGNTLPAGKGDRVLRFDVVLPPVADNSQHPSTIAKFYDLPVVEPPRVTRRFRFERGNGQWQTNGRFFDCNDVRFRVQKNSGENWIFQNNSGGWQHPIHVHFEEFQILSRNGRTPQGVERSRKDVVRLGFNEEIKVFMRFRDFVGPYLQHCHNTVHEDHAMMLRFDIDEIGDRKTEP